MILSPFGWRHRLTARFFFPLLAVSALTLSLFAGWQRYQEPWHGLRLSA